MSKEMIEKQKEAYETQLSDCVSRIKAAEDSAEQLKAQREQLKGAVFAATEAIKLFDDQEKEKDDGKK